MGERKRSEVFTAFGGRSTVVESCPFFLKKLFWGEVWRVWVFCGSVLLKEHPRGC